MRLLHSGNRILREFPNRAPRYAILSHTWDVEEVSFDDMRSGLAPSLKGYIKVLGACNQALLDGYEWVWIDTCCIDKSSSTELQEAINSMYEWYRKADACYVYLIDVPDANAGWDHRFGSSRWWSRGWTLQELIAPKHVEFYASDWSFIGTKLQRREQISKITGISAAVLDHSHDGEIVAANKMSWAAKRETTRSEDRAYCLLGLFGVNMPLLYGEGGARAFIRLQEEIMRRREDHSLFLWERPFRSDPKLPLLSTSAAFFAHIRTANLGETLPKAPALTDISQLNIVHGNNRWAYHSLHGGTTREIGLPISFTSQGVRLNLWLLDIRDLRILPLEVEETTTHIALLNLHLGPSYVYIGIYLRVLESATNVFRRNDMTYCIITKSIWGHYSDKQRYVELYIDQPEHQNIPAPVTLEPPPTLPDAIILDVNRNPFRAVACTWSLNKAASGSTKYGLFLNQSGRLVVKSANPNPFELCLTLRHGTETKMEELGVKLRFSAKTELSSPGFSIKCDIQAAQVKEWQKGSTSSVWDDRHSESTVSDGQLVTVGTRMRVCVGMKPLGPLFEPGASDRYIPTYRLYIEDLNMSGNQRTKSGDSSSWNQQDFWQKVFSEDARGKGIQVHDVQEREIEVPKITVQQPA